MALSAHDVERTLDDSTAAHQPGSSPGACSVFERVRARAELALGPRFISSDA